MYFISVAVTLFSSVSFFFLFWSVMNEKRAEMPFKREFIQIENRRLCNVDDGGDCWPPGECYRYA